MALRVGVLTFHCSNSCGAVLQAYAMCKTIEELGCSPCVIDYRPKFLSASPPPRSQRPLGILEKVWRKWHNRQFAEAWNNVVRDRRFERFRREFLPTTKRTYWNIEELRADPPGVDVCVCGSDQIWNLNLFGERLGLDPTFFLDFVPPAVRRVAYAPSLGGVAFPQDVRDEVAVLLKKFSALSGRENDVGALVKQLTGRDAPTVLDPSLLIDDYSAVIRKPKWPPRRYILAYPLDYSQPFVECVRRAKELLNLPVVNIGRDRLPGADVNRCSLGPSEWLGWMRDASFVCTNSFHGTAYSLLFRRNFVAFSFLRRPANNVRMQGILEQVGLSERFLADAAPLAEGGLCRRAVDYSKVVPLLQAAISRSRQYLKNALYATPDSAN
ncbi:MAG: polysaccharide pyruvyl transferase family protein [Thermoguttaceae bacterium]